MEFVKTYFNAEKAESLLFVGIGVISILISLYFWLQLKRPFYNGLAYPFFLIGIIQVTAGTIVYLRSPNDLERVENYLVLEPEKIAQVEIPRMTIVMKNFVYYRYLEVALIITGIVLMFYTSNADLVKGIGIGLFIQASMMLAADYFAERRGDQYLNRMQEHAAVWNKQS